MFHHSARVLSQSWWYQRMLMEVWKEEWGWGIRPTHKAIEQREKNDTTGGEWQAGVPPCINHWNLHLGIKLTKGSKASPSRTSEIIGTVVQFLEYLKWRSIKLLHSESRKEGTQEVGGLETTWVSLVLLSAAHGLSQTPVFQAHFGHSVIC